MSTGGQSRRNFLKTTGAMTAAGALGTLAGCTGGGDDGGGGQDGEDGQDSDGSDGGGQESVEISFLSAEAVENSQTKPHFQETMRRFEDQKGDVEVSLQTASYGDIKEKLASSVQGGNPPTLAESGSTGLQFFFQGKVPNHDKWIEETPEFPDQWSQANKDTALFRDEFWCGGSIRHSVSNLGIRPKLFSQAGVSSPDKFETWSGFYEALQMVNEEFPDTFAYEETGVWNDLESYWGYSHTAYTDGTDPWIRGDPTDPDVIVDSDHEDRPKTDGMIEMAVKLAREFSSSESPSRADEDIPSLMLTDRVASFTYATQNYARWRTVKEDAKIGWHDGDGDFMLLPNPKVDPDFGSKIGISDLEGVEGQHGGHVWALEQAHAVFEGDFSEKQKQRAWDLNVFLHRDKQFVLKEYGELYQSIPADQDMMGVLQEEYPDQPQNFVQVLENLQNYPKQYVTTGAPWDVKGTDQIRWKDLNETISQGIAGQHSAEETPSVVRERIDKTLAEKNN